MFPATQTSSSNLLTTMAILLANYDADRDYLSNFEPFVKDCLKKWPAKAPVASKALCEALSNAYNLPRIPINTVTQLRERARRAGYVHRDAAGDFYPSRRALSKVQSLVSREIVFLEHFDRLAETICAYATEERNCNWGPGDAERALESFAQEFSVELAMARRTGVLGEAPASRRGEELAIMHGFARRSLERDQQSLDYLEEVVQASMLANVVYLQDLGTWKPDLGQLVVYLDTTVAFRALALTDDEVSEAAREMIELLGEFNVPLRIFEHTFSEMRGVLRSVRECLREEGQGRTNLNLIPRQGLEVLSHALRTGWGPADTEEVAIELEGRLASVGIAVASTPRQDHRLRLDERRLDEALSEAGFRHGQRQRDIESLVAIHNLREGRSPNDLGRARAIFITSNETLVKAARHWFGEQGHDGGVPQCVTETSFTTQLWLRQPEGRPNVALKFLVAGSYAALNPSPKMWERYLDRIAQRRERAQITEQQVKTLVYSTEAKESLAEVAHGDPERVDDAAIAEVLARSRLLPAEFVRKLESTGADIEFLREENRAMREEIEQRDLRLRDQSTQLASQNNQIAVLHRSIERLISSDERRCERERRLVFKLTLARRSFGGVVAVLFLAGTTAIWLLGDMSGGRWFVSALILAGTLPAFLLGLAGIDRQAVDEAPKKAPDASVPTRAEPKP
jgi:hypothetical protein